MRQRLATMCPTTQVKAIAAHRWLEKAVGVRQARRLPPDDRHIPREAFNQVVGADDPFHLSPPLCVRRLTTAGEGEYLRGQVLV